MPVDKSVLKFYSTAPTLNSFFRSSDGFTLVEVLVATAVAGLLLVAFSTLLLTGFQVQGLAVSTGDFSVRGQKVLAQMVDGAEGLFFAEEVVWPEPSNGEKTVNQVTYILNDKEISYYQEGTVIKRTVKDPTVKDSDGKVIVLTEMVLADVATFQVSFTPPSVELQICSEKGVKLATVVAPRNLK